MVVLTVSGPVGDAEIGTVVSGASDSIDVWPSSGHLYLFIHQSATWRMTLLSFDETGVDVVYDGTEFRLEKALIEDAIGKQYPDVTDHEVLKIVEPNPSLSGEPQRISDILG